MANFPGLILTNGGRDILAKAIGGQPLVFTRIALGDGAEPVEPEALTGLVSEVDTASIQSFEMVGDGTSKIRSVVTNVGVTNGFFVREIGVFARDPDTQDEVLYSYANSGAQSDFLPAEGGATVVEQVFDLFTVVSSAQDVSAVINEFITLATKFDINEIRPFLLPPGGLAGQLLRKVSFEDGDTEWVDPDTVLGGQVSLVGPDLVFVGSSNTYTITNFDAFSDYSVSSSVGTVARTGETITLDIGAGETEPVLSLSVERDGAAAVYSIAIGAQSVAEPSILTPTDGATNVGANPTLVTSAFATYPGGADTHASTDWQVATDVGFTAIVFESLSDASNLESIEVPGATLAVSTTYYVRALHNGSSLGASPYSEVSSFATADSFIATPAIVSPADGAEGIATNATIESSPFAIESGAGTHSSSDWEISATADFSGGLAYSVYGTSSLTVLNVPNGYLANLSEHHVRVRYRSGSGQVSDWSAASSFTTEAAAGQAQYTQDGAYSFIVPAGVFSISAVAVGSGAPGGSGNNTNGGGGGPAGCTAYANDVAVTPGETLSLVVPEGGLRSGALGGNGSPGAPATISRGGTGLLEAFGGQSGGFGNGQPGSNSGLSAPGQGTEFDGGGIGGDGGSGVSDPNGGLGGGGGGAGGYAGPGGDGGNGGADGTAGQGGGAGGGAGGNDSSYSDAKAGAGGGGVGLFGQGASGAGGIIFGVSVNGGERGSLGDGGDPVGSYNQGGVGGEFGGGSGGGPADGLSNSAETGAIRIIWPGSTRQFPNTNTN